MKKLFVGAIAILFVSACSPSTRTDTGSFNMPADLRNCEIVKLQRGGLPNDRVYLLRCPNGVPKEYAGTTTVYSSGKHKVNNAVIVE